MKNPISKLGPDIIGFLELRESLGYSRKSYEYQLSKIDEYIAEVFPSLDVMTEEIVFGWSRRRSNESQNSRRIRLNVIRAFGKYQKGIGKHAFVLPTDSIDREQPFNPYLFTDEELARFFLAVDSLPPHHLAPYREHIIPVLFRMIYCCALRPAEPMQLLRQDVDLDKGTLFIRNSKRHKDRMVTMSEDLLRFCRTFDFMMGARQYFFELRTTDMDRRRWMNRQFNLCKKIAGIGNGTQSPRPYDLRHAACSRVILNWLAEGKDFYELAVSLREHMGHGSFRETFYYIHMLPENIIKNSGFNWSRFDCLYPEVNDEKA